MRTHHRHPKSRQCGFTVMEVVLSLSIFLMMVLVFAAAFPLVSSQAQASDNTAQATIMVQHKMDQVRAAGFANLALSSSLLATGDIDSSPAPTASAVPYSAAFTGVDNLAALSGPGSGYFPAGTTGTILVQDLNTVNPALGTPAGSVYEVTVTITWPAGGGGAHGGTCSSSTLISEQGGGAKI